MLSARNLCKSFGSLDVLQDISVDLEPGTITTLIGPSGGGKSTLLRALSLLEPPDSGILSFDGSEFTFPVQEDCPLPPMPWPRLTVVFQQLFLWPHLTLRQNIELPLRCIDQTTTSRRSSEIIKEMGIGAFVDRYPNEASLGQRQLCAIARALTLQPKYLLLDEITSSLDVEYVARVLQLIQKRREKGVAILIITHYIGFARRSADQVLFLEHARITERGTAEILERPGTERLQAFLSLLLTAH
jgi:ABC-type polar amino acid transport system ATPase subunit